LLQTDAEPALERATSTILAAMEFDVSQSERLAREVQAVRRATTNNIIFLDALATAIAAFTAVIAFRTARNHERLLRRHNELLTDRVTELDRFAVRAAHDILSPLDTVAVGLALLGRSADPRAHASLERSQRALQRVQQLVQGLLQFARAGVHEHGDVRCAVVPVIEMVAADFAEIARVSRIEIRVECHQQIDAACSMGVLTSVVQNLVSNAIKYMGAQPVRRVTLRAAATGGHARIEVEDTGPGIPDDLQPSIFEAFVRGSDHDQVSGLGLGLATVKRLAEAHGGSVELRSKAGVGTLFRVELPLARAAEAVAV